MIKKIKYFFIKYKFKFLCFLGVVFSFFSLTSFTTVYMVGNPSSSASGNYNFSDENQVADSTDNSDYFSVFFTSPLNTKIDFREGYCSFFIPISDRKITSLNSFYLYYDASTSIGTNFSITIQDIGDIYGVVVQHEDIDYYVINEGSLSLTKSGNYYYARINGDSVGSSIFYSSYTGSLTIDIEYVYENTSYDNLVLSYDTSLQYSNRPVAGSVDSLLQYDFYVNNPNNTSIQVNAVVDNGQVIDGTSTFTIPTGRNKMSLFVKENKTFNLSFNFSGSSFSNSLEFYSYSNVPISIEYVSTTFESNQYRVNYKYTNMNLDANGDINVNVLINGSNKLVKSLQFGSNIADYVVIDSNESGTLQLDDLMGSEKSNIIIFSAYVPPTETKALVISSEQSNIFYNETDYYVILNIKNPNNFIINSSYYDVLDKNNNNVARTSTKNDISANGNVSFYVYLKENIYTSLSVVLNYDSEVYTSNTLNFNVYVPPSSGNNQIWKINFNTSNLSSFDNFYLSTDLYTFNDSSDPFAGYNFLENNTLTFDNNIIDVFNENSPSSLLFNGTLNTNIDYNDIQYSINYTIKYNSFTQTNTITNISNNDKEFSVSVMEYFDKFIQRIEPYWSIDKTSTFEITINSLAWTPYIDNGYEVLDINSLLFTILTMPFTFFSQAFNFTFFEGTAYAFNISDTLLLVVCVLIIIYLVKLIMGLKG